MAAASRQPTHVLVLAGSPLAAELRRLLADGAEVRAPDDEAAPEADGAERGPDVVVVDSIGGFSLPPKLRDVPALAVVRRDAPGDVIAAVEAGAYDVIPMPFVASEVRSRVAAAARLCAAEAALRSRNAALAAWADRVGHDLMTPLAVISGMAETLETAWDRLPEADRSRVLASIRNQAARATAMLDGAFALARDPMQEPGVDTSGLGR